LDSESYDTRKVAYIAILSFGLVSLFGDIIYEGARGIISPYLQSLGATALIIGVAVSLGDFLGYSLRMISGYIADVKKSYWLFVFLGYGLLISIPLLAFAGYWQIAIILVLIERTAKAFRSPARDTLLSATTKDVGTGKAFGFHELMDQLGAVSGPLIIALILYFTGNNYFQAFSTLFVPYIILMIILSIVYIKINPYTSKALSEIGEKRVMKGSDSGFSAAFILYNLAVIINTAGLINVQLILYLAGFIMEPWLISILYLMVQGVDAIFAPISGHLYDKYGRKILAIPFALSAIPTIFALMRDYNSIIISCIFFGIILGMQESIYRAAVSDLTTVERRGTAYGIFYTSYGLGFLIGGTVFGWFIDSNLFVTAIIYSVIAQSLAIIILSLSQRKE